MTAFVLKAVAAALKKFPAFNASLDPEAGGGHLEGSVQVSASPWIPNKA